jgi:small ligand-binding sensory domain FIST
LVSQTPLVGGLAAGGVFGGTSGVAISGGVAVRTIVSQGCRPTGRSFVVTRAEGNVIQELAGQPALRRFEEVMHHADPRDRRLVRDGLFVGIVIDEYKEEFERGDFLIRPVLGADPRTGALAVGDYVEVGRTVRFQVRDAESADEDLRTMLAGVRDRPAGALLFTCNGRGSRLFGVPDHDVSAIRDALPALPVAGFFCNGEIGPVGGRNFLHGFTASVAFFSAGTR